MYTGSIWLDVYALNEPVLSHVTANLKNTIKTKNIKYTNDT